MSFATEQVTRIETLLAAIQRSSVEATGEDSIHVRR
jgi:hypothetical protein